MLVNNEVFMCVQVHSYLCMHVCMCMYVLVHDDVCASSYMCNECV